MAMTLRLTDGELDALRQRAEIEGISMQEATRQAVREYAFNSRDRVWSALNLTLDTHSDAL
jgi:hypothetical protein